MKNIVVIGGGTAGWISALYAQKKTNQKITVIESSEIGILGAGEGTTPSFMRLLQEIEIDYLDLIKNVDATIKNGIKFSGWNGKKEDYFFHGFRSKDFMHYSDNSIENNFIDIIDIPDIIEYSIKNNENINSYYIAFHASQNDRVCINKDNKKDFGMFRYALHFNARSLAEFLKKIALQRGIDLIDAKVTNLAVDDKKNISLIELSNGSSVKPDFVIDCTGFSRLIVGQFYQTEWESFKEFLPMKKAIAFFLPPTEKSLNPYTEAISMKYGWMWKIPLQSRYGCGYVFDSDYINEEDAKKEVEDFLNHPIEIVKTFPFNPGTYKNILVNNVLSIGLASGFLEPLEATSLLQACNDLRKFFSGTIENIFDIKAAEYERYNYLHKKETYAIARFIYLHYICTRKDTEFWQQFEEKNKVPESIQSILQSVSNPDELKLSILKESDIFDFTSYYFILYGNGIINLSSYNNNSMPRLSPDIAYDRKKIIQETSGLMMDHLEFIKKTVDEK